MTNKLHNFHVSHPIIGTSDDDLPQHPRCDEDDEKHGQNCEYPSAAKSMRSVSGLSDLNQKNVYGQIRP